MRKTASGRWVDDKPPKNMAPKKEPTPTEALQASVRASIGLPDNPFDYLAAPEEYPVLRMPEIWPIELLWMQVGREVLRDGC